jgi:hypothetical protein
MFFNVLAAFRQFVWKYRYKNKSAFYSYYKTIKGFFLTFIGDYVPFQVIENISIKLHKLSG